MQIFKCSDWNDYERRLEAYFAKSQTVRDSFVFRGVADSSWGLETTLDRCHGVEPKLRNEQFEELIEIFSEQCLGIAKTRKPKQNADDEFDLLARHHGLPSPILDWTKSPFIAAFFAFCDPIHATSSPPRSIGVYMLNRAKAMEVSEDPRSQAISQSIIEIRDHRLLSDNPRAIEQQSVFYRVLDTESSLVETLGEWIYQFTIPVTQRNYALSKLDAMNINHRSLFKDLDSAAKTALFRFQSRSRGEK